MTDRIRRGWVKFIECGKVLCDKRFPLRLKRSAYKSHWRPAILFGSEVRYLREDQMEIFRCVESGNVRVIYTIMLADRKSVKDMMQMLDLKEAID